MISLLSGRLLPRPRAVTAAAEHGGGRSGFSGRSGSSSKRGGGRGGGGGSKNSHGGGRGGGGRNGNIGTNTAAPKKVVTDAGDPPEVSNEPSLLCAPMEVSLHGEKEEFWEREIEGERESTQTQLSRPTTSTSSKKKLSLSLFFQQVVVLERDEAPEAAVSPLWDSFCGTSAGGWQGIATAVSPVTGEREAVGLVDARVVVESRDEIADPDDPSVVRSVVRTKTKIVKRDILALATYTVERRTGGRAGGKGTDRLTRRTVRSPTTAGLAAVAAAEAEEQAEAEGGGGKEDDTTEAIVPITSPSSPSFDGVNDALRSKEPGLVVFDGGTCSRGPLNLLGLPPLTTAGRSSSSSRGGGGAGGGGNVEGIDVDAEREALERLVALSPSTSALGLGSEGRGKRRTAGERSPPEEDWSSLDGGRLGRNEGDGNSDDTDGEIEIIDIAASPDSGEDPEAIVSVIESCLAWGGEQRLRVQLTLSVSDGERESVLGFLVLVLDEEEEEGEGFCSAHFRFFISLDQLSLTETKQTATSSTSPRCASSSPGRPGSASPTVTWPPAPSIPRRPTEGRMRELPLLLLPPLPPSRAAPRRSRPRRRSRARGRSSTSARTRSLRAQTEEEEEEAEAEEAAAAKETAPAKSPRRSTSTTPTSRSRRSTRPRARSSGGPSTRPSSRGTAAGPTRCPTRGRRRPK